MKATFGKVLKSFVGRVQSHIKFSCLSVVQATVSTINFINVQMALRPGRLAYERAEMLVISLRGVNFGFLSHYSMDKTWGRPWPTL